MNKFKKVFIAFVASALAVTNVVGLAGCAGLGGGGTGGGGGTPNYQDETKVVAYDGSKVTITFQHTMGATLTDVFKTYLAKFNEKYPNITVEATCPTNDYDELRAQISTGLTVSESPSVAFCYPDHVALYNITGAVANLDGFISSQEKVANTDEIMGLTTEQQNDYVPVFYNEGKAYGDDKMYTLPFFKSTEVLYYNKTKFEEHGWTLPSDRPITWTEMKELCAKIKAAYPNDIPLGYDSDANWFITMTEQYGSGYTSVTGDNFIFNNEQNQAFVTEFQDWYNKGYVTTKTLNSNTYTSNLFNETDDNKQQCFMCIGSTGGSSYQAPTADGEGNDPFEVGVAMIPQVEGKASKVIQQGPSICIFKKASAQEMAASWLFAKFFTTSVQFQANVAMKNGYMPVIQSVQNNEIYQNWLKNANSGLNADLQATTVKQAMSQIDSYYISPAFEGSSAAREYVGILMSKCIGNKNVNVADEFKKTVDQLIYKFS